MPGARCSAPLASHRFTHIPQVHAHRHVGASGHQHESASRVAGCSGGDAVLQAALERDPAATRSAPGVARRTTSRSARMAGRPGRLRSMTPARLALRPRPRGGRVRPIGTGPAGRTHGLGALGTLPGRLREGVACDAGSALFAACLEGRRRSSAGVAGLPSRRVLARECRLRRLDNGPALDEKAPGVHPRGQRQGG